MNTLSLAAALIIGTITLFYFIKVLLYVLAYLLVIIISALPLLFLLGGIFYGLRIGYPLGSVPIYLLFFSGAGVWVLWLRSSTFKKVYEKIRPKLKVDDIYKIDITKLNKPPQEKK
ncbi:MAG: hypothetical protein GWP06_17685 [Actinobacteria bacterium]|nr:hypothetical protein [Actinomycetota bacterium]